MKKIFLLIVTVAIAQVIFAQVDTAATVLKANAAMETPKPKKKKYDLSARASDHLLIQLGYTSWLNTPDSIKTRGFSKSINAYFMFDFPFKSSPKLSAAAGLGIGSDRIALAKGIFPNVKGSTSTLRFLDPAYTSLYKRTTLVTSFLELPVELRYSGDPEHTGKSFKFALGAKLGTMLRGGTRNRSNDATYLEKEFSKKYFNTTRIVGTARIGYGHITLFANYQFTNTFKDVLGPPVKPFTVGLTFSGL